MILKGKGGIQYDLVTPPFAQGGEGQIFNINGHKDKVAKLYKQGTATFVQERKLIKMIMSPPSQDILDQIAWPLDVLYDNGQAVGFVMRKFQLNEDLNIIYEYGASAKYPQVTWGNKIHIAKNLCAVLNAVHEAGHVCGDFNPKNISLDPGTSCVTFVDTDSYHITDGQDVYRCNVGMPEYLPPEIQVKMKNGHGLASAPLPTFGPETDNFGLAVHIFQLLMNGCHPFACAVIPSTASVVYPDTADSILKGECPFLINVPGKKIPAYAPAIDILPDEIQQLFRRAFVDGHKSPSARPSAETWYYALDRLEKSLKKCPNVPYHEYFSNLPSCPWCAVDKNFSKLSGNSQGLTQTVYTPIAAPRNLGPTVKANNFSSNSNVGMTSGSTFNAGGLSIKARKRILTAAAALALAATAVAAGSGIKASIANEKVDAVNQMISGLPDSISDYCYFEKEIVNAHAAYMELDYKLQSRIDNTEKLFTCMEGFNSGQVELIRQALSEISEDSEDSVQNTSVFERLDQLHGKLNNEQKAMLTKDENQALEQISCVYATIKGIEDLLDDIVGKYDTISEIKKNYITLTDHYKGLVYNYSELDAADEMYHLISSLEFSSGNGGWAVSAKADARGSLSGDIVIPSEYQGQPITTIPEKAFSGCTGISSITVPDSVTSIGKGAFSGCIGLQSVTLPFVGESRTASNVKGHFGYIFGEDPYSGGIQIEQFYGPYSYITGKYYIPSQLKKVTITDAIQLSSGAFHNCSMLTAINLNSAIIGAEAKVFMNCSEITTVNIPNITVISESMFSGCSLLTTLTLSESVMRIEEKAFEGCVNLDSLNSEVEGDIVIGNSVQFIGKSAFSGCIKIKSITLPFVGTSRTASNVKGHFGYIFGEDSYSGGIQIEQFYGPYSYITGKYYIPNQLKKVTVTDAAQLSEGAFHNCSMLNQLTINSDAKNSVGNKAFEGCVRPTWN